jgi:hypothetical protein
MKDLYLGVDLVVHIGVGLEDDLQSFYLENSSQIIVSSQKFLKQIFWSQKFFQNSFFCLRILFHHKNCSEIIFWSQKFFQNSFFCLRILFHHKNCSEIIFWSQKFFQNYFFVSEFFFTTNIVQKLFFGHKNSFIPFFYFVIFVHAEIWFWNSFLIRKFLSAKE